MQKSQKKKQEENVLETSEGLIQYFLKIGNKIYENQNYGIGILVIISVFIGGFLYYRYLQEDETKEAQKNMIQAVFYFESDSIAKALNGDGNNMGFSEIADEYSFTAPGKLAYFYAGACYMKMRDFSNAITYFDNFESDDILIQARTYALIGDCYMELGDYTSASNYYEKASEYKPNQAFSPTYYTKAALAYELNKEYTYASSCYESIIEKFPDSPEISTAKKEKARLDILANQ
ncbi:MAG: tetratricopeptide repeat protein [Chitinophagaceae bacterium]|nr:tetratricopeptide repeat protein [Chitinophagaceae bacterium]